MTFQTLGLSKGLLDALASKKYNDPTPIQRDAIPLVLEGRDLLGIAQTGTGKTAAFMLPAIDRLVAASRGRLVPGRIRMLVLAPTRELAAQIAAAARTYATNTDLSVGVIFGGVSNEKSLREVRRGLDVLVATPGRLLDLADRRALDLSSLEILVLDEADQMLDLGFIHALKAILKLIPAKRQTLFFSATMPKTIRQLADTYLKNAAQVSVAPTAAPAERVDQSVTFVNQKEKPALLALILKSSEVERALIFSRTKHGADRIVRFLAAAGIESNAIHGNKSQGQRERALGLFRSGEVPILVATDIAARGIDIPGVSHVLNFDLPNVPEQYVHRIGRTGRAGAAGIAVAFCSDEERSFLRSIERLTRQKIDVAALPQDFAANAQSLQRLAVREPARNVRGATSDSGRRDNNHGRRDGERRHKQWHSRRDNRPPANRSASGDFKPRSGPSARRDGTR